MTEKEYRELDAISQSALKDFIQNRKLYEYCHVLGLGNGKSTKAMDLGSVNHTLLFEPEEFHNRYAHFDGQLPSASANMQKFYDLCFVDNNDMSITDIYANCYSTKTMKPDKVWEAAETLRSNLLPYYNFQQENGHKEMLSPDVELVSRQMVEKMYEHEGVRKTLLAGRQNPKFKVFKELAIIWEHFEPTPLLKSKVDEVHVHVEEGIMYAYDYKTTRSQNVNSFKGSCKFYGYDIQESFYAEALKNWGASTFGREFMVVFRFIPQLNVAPYNVLDVIEFSPDDRETAYCKWSEALSDLRQCLETGQFDNPAAYSESGVNMLVLHDVNMLVVENGGDF